MQPPKYNNGFTLIELAVVLTIIGLIIGGIIIGSTMIRSSEIQSLTAESAKFTHAIKSFQNKYNTLPGDFNEATNIWGAANPDPTTCITTVGAAETATCNGDGNGKIANLDDYENTYYEQYRAWQHLSNAKLIEGGYTGAITSSGDFCSYRIGSEIPASRLNRAGWKMITITLNDLVNDTNGIASNNVFYTPKEVPYNVVLWVGGDFSDTDFCNMRGVLTPVEAYTLDKKVDDGLASRGKWVAQQSGGMCDSGGDNYGINGSFKTTKSCALIVKTGL